MNMSMLRIGRKNEEQKTHVIARAFSDAIGLPVGTDISFNLSGNAEVRGTIVEQNRGEIRVLSETKGYKGVQEIRLHLRYFPDGPAYVYDISSQTQTSPSWGYFMLNRLLKKTK